MATPKQGWRSQTPLRGSARGGFRGTKGGRGGGEVSGLKPCRYFQQTRHCRYGDRCTFSHDLSSGSVDEGPSNRSREKPEETFEQQIAKADYNAWKRLIKNPPKSNDIQTIRSIWTGALKILNGDDRDCKQMLPRDLDDDEYRGREHIHTLMNIVAHAHGYATFVNLARPFLMVITHPAVLDCLSVDTSVGGLYNFISGNQGSRAMPFFKRLSTAVLEQHLESGTPDSTDISETTIIAMSTAIREMLRREQRATFHEDLAELVDSVDSVVEATGIKPNSVVFQIVRNIISEIHGMVARAKGLLQQEEAPQVAGVSTTVVTSTYPRELHVPRDRHNNDKLDITKINILPTEDEIRSDHPPFLPSTDLDQPHFLVDQAERHLDTQFRLLRHDIFGELGEVLGGMMIALENDPAPLKDPKFHLGNVRAYHNAKAWVSYISFDQRGGLQAQISFPQPFLLRKKTAPERRKWWEESRRMEEGILLCLLHIENAKCSLLFFTVSEKVIDQRKEHGLSFDKHRATITARLASKSQHDLEMLSRLSYQHTHGVLIEFPGVILATFVPILENIQNMQRLSRLPFRQWILPDRVPPKQVPELLEIPPPLYARSPGFRFSLKPIMRESDNDIHIDRSTLVENGDAIDALEAGTHLDRGQCQALIAALTREFAFIQGPPGTGKSYLGVQLMRVLLKCKEGAKLGPVIVVCYTNHALDQFLEHLIEVGIEKVIRIGGQSQSAVLEGKNLRLVSQGEAKAKSEGYLLAKTYQALQNEERTIQKLLKMLHGTQKERTWKIMERHLRQNHPLIHVQFCRFDSENFEIVGREPFDVWMDGDQPTLKEQNDIVKPPPALIEQILAQATQNVHSIPLRDRYRLVDSWIENLRNETTDELFESTKNADKLHKELDNVHDDVDRRVLQTADVIGVTTTGLARRIATLQHVKCKVVICEEAGEVMEPHIISALLPSVEHFIQIGDHEQLRPQINNYRLSLESQQGVPYQLDRSQFERLSKGERGRPSFPLAQLNVQRRMRPEISTLIRETIYPRLVDHDSTKSLPDVVGMRKNLFWLDHDSIEEGAQADVHQKSHSNLWEIDMVHALVRHVLRQGVYNSSDIAVLTPYTGQLQKLRAKMRNDFEIVLSERDKETLTKEGFNIEDDSQDGDQTDSKVGSGQRPLQKKKMSELLRIATVDNFQGEEAKVVIVSLVRSNKERKVGFLKTTNRINVLISRAQNGMYLIGNADTYSNQPMWAHVQRMLQGMDSVGKAFALCCPRHPDTEIMVSQPDDFARLSPEGGCQLSCDRRLPDCGHRCQAKCHSESMHQVFSCPQPCQRLQSPCNHDCQKPTCGEDCGLCMVKLNNVQLPCGHSKDGVPCHSTQDREKVQCTIPVRKDVPKCKHVVEIPCYRDVSSALFSCPTVCGSTLACGHLCSGTCGKCNSKDANNQPAMKHSSCSKVCGRRFGTCNHACRRLCHEGKDCGPCPSYCEVRCAHSQCTLRCHEACAPCVEQCTWSCEHEGSCCMPCAAPCSRLPCNQRCTKDLSCGHQCPGLCGETCPEAYCQTCSDHKEDRVDLLEMKNYGEISLDETPVVVLGCGHFFTAETLDGLMGMGEVYLKDGYGNFTGLQDTSTALASKLPFCPDCRCPVRQYCTQRYNRVVNRAVIDEMSKRFLVSGKDELRELEQHIVELERFLEESREEILNSIRQVVDEAAAHVTRRLTPAKAYQLKKSLEERLEKSKDIERKIQRFKNKVEDKHQPAKKLHDATVNAARKRPMEQLMADLDVTGSVPAVQRDRRITFGSRVAQLQAECITIVDTLTIAKVLKGLPFGVNLKLPGVSPADRVNPFFEACGVFIKDCAEESLPKMGVEATLFYAKVARSNVSYSRSTENDVARAAEHVNTAKELLGKAKEDCTRPFQNADALGNAVENMLKLLGKEWYEEVTSEELAEIKQAMVSGYGGLATHSGHWYNCVGGHPFAIGECGMPMEQARCPECGAPVGGQGHQAVEGVTRATNMEG